MSEEDFLKLVKAIRVVDSTVMNVPIEETGLDSLDLTLLRAQIEVALGRSTEDRLWRNSLRLRDLLNAL